jgi:hypothetical protein
MGKRVLVLIGTKKGTFIAESDAARKDWQVRGPLCGAQVEFDGFTFTQQLVTMDVNFDPQSQTLFAATAGPGGSGNFEGKRLPAVQRSTDLGETWTASSEGLTYGEGGPEIEKVWSIQPPTTA